MCSPQIIPRRKYFTLITLQGSRCKKSHPEVKFAYQQVPKTSEENLYSYQTVSFLLYLYLCLYCICKFVHLAEHASTMTFQRSMHNGDSGDNQYSSQRVYFNFLLYLHLSLYLSLYFLCICTFVPLTEHASNMTFRVFPRIDFGDPPPSKSDKTPLRS